MKLLISVLIASVVATTVARADDMSAIQQTIDAAVWGPFQRAFENLDGDALNGLYADKVLRATPAGIDTQQAFKLTNRTRFKANQARGDRIALDFWFDSRRTNATYSYDVGFYRVQIIAPGGSTETFYGQFHIVLRKLQGTWKIVQDWDTAMIGGEPISAELFARQPPAQFRSHSSTLEP